MTASPIVLSKETIDILKIAASVNQNLLFREGSNLVWSKSVAGNVILKTEVAEEFPCEFPVYNLNELLSSLTLFKAPELLFNEKYIVITEAGMKKGPKLQYKASAKEVLVFPSKNAQLPAWDASFKLPRSILNQVVKASGVIQAPDLQIVGSEDGIVLKVIDKVSVENVMEIPVSDDPQTKSFAADLKVENLKLIDDDYDVNLSFLGIVNFASARMNLYVSMETSSKV